MDVTYPSACRIVKSARGHTLIEVVATLGIAAILLGMALPAMGELVSDNRLSGQVNEFAAHLNYARSEAIKSGYSIEVCKSRDAGNCSSSAQWSDGWLIFADRDNDRQRDASEPILKAHGILDNDLQLDYGGFPTANYIVYYPEGTSHGNGTFTFCDSRGPDEAHALILYKSGRLRPSRSMPDGSTLGCPG